MGKFSDELLFGMTIRESANDGSDFTNPAADYRRLFLGEDGQLHVRDSAGTVTDIGTAGGGGIATDTLWDAAGDLAQGTGANTGAKLTLGASGKAVMSTGSTNAYLFPPGHEFDYVEKTSSTNITATSSATADTIVTATAVAYDGSTVIEIEFSAMFVAIPAGESLLLDLYDGSSSIGILAQFTNPAGGVLRIGSVICKRRLTPAAATKTYSIRGWVGSGTGVVTAGAGGAGVTMPAFIRTTKAT